jgi:hypothetical protein
MVGFNVIVLTSFKSWGGGGTARLFGPGILTKLPSLSTISGLLLSNSNLTIAVHPPDNLTRIVEKNGGCEASFIMLVMEFDELACTRRESASALL